jgi:hypothetical protein
MGGTMNDNDVITDPPVKKRKRRTNAELDQLDRQIIEVMADDHPQSVRHMFYRMTNPRLPVFVPKTDHGKGNGYGVVQRRMVELRRNGRLPYGWVTDATRRGYHTITYGGASEFIQRVKGMYRADLWAQSDYYCEVWTESRSIAGIIEDDCRELAVSLYPAGGFTSLTLAYQAAEIINFDHSGREVIILYIGDYDPAGVLIDVKIEEELRRHLRADIRMTFRRIGITEQQIALYDLPAKPRKEADKRALHISETVEAEAMPAKILRRVLREQIEALLPYDALKVAKAAEESERLLLGHLADLAS